MRKRAAPSSSQASTVPPKTLPYGLRWRSITRWRVETSNSEGKEKDSCVMLCSPAANCSPPSVPHFPSPGSARVSAPPSEIDGGRRRRKFHPAARPDFPPRPAVEVRPPEGRRGGGEQEAGSHGELALSDVALAE